jgi:L-ribulose-5-phosphate 3-epimerase UlaE
VHNYEKQDELLNEAFDLLHDEIAVIHAKDFVVENGAVKSVVSGKGLLNYDLLMSLIKKYKPHIHVLLEDTKPENAIETKEFVERKYAEA